MRPSSNGVRGPWRSNACSDDCRARPSLSSRWPTSTAVHGFLLCRRDENVIALHTVQFHRRNVTETHDIIGPFFETGCPCAVYCHGSGRSTEWRRGVLLGYAGDDLLRLVVHLVDVGLDVTAALKEVFQLPLDYLNVLLLMLNTIEWTLFSFLLCYLVLPTLTQFEAVPSVLSFYVKFYLTFSNWSCFIGSCFTDL